MDIEEILHSCRIITVVKTLANLMLKLSIELIIYILVLQMALKHGYEAIFMKWDKDSLKESMICKCIGISIE